MNCCNSVGVQLPPVMEWRSMSRHTKRVNQANDGDGFFLTEVHFHALTKQLSQQRQPPTILTSLCNTFLRILKSWSMDKVETHPQYCEDFYQWYYHHLYQQFLTRFKCNIFLIPNSWQTFSMSCIAASASANLAAPKNTFPMWHPTPSARSNSSSSSM